MLLDDFDISAVTRDATSCQISKDIQDVEVLSSELPF